MKYAKMFALALTFMPLLATAQFNGPSKIVTQVPFEFRVGDKLFPAGECTIQAPALNKQALIIRNIRAGVSAVTSAQSRELMRPSVHFAMVFHRYGNTYFLTGVKVAGLQQMYGLPVGRAEAELRAKAVPATEQILLASE